MIFKVLHSIFKVLLVGTQTHIDIDTHTYTHIPLVPPTSRI